jgi:hypothetical protein
MPVILATQEAEIRRIKVLGQPGQISCKTCLENNKHGHSKMAASRRKQKVSLLK